MNFTKLKCVSQNVDLKGGKICFYYDNDRLVCSMFYIPSNQKTLNKRNINA